MRVHAIEPMRPRVRRMRPMHGDFTRSPAARKLTRTRRLQRRAKVRAA